MKFSPIKYFLFAFLLIIIDQASKLWVHFNMLPEFIGQIKLIGDWFKLYYVTNPGMAFGMQIDHEYGKLFLTVFRLFAMFFIAYYMVTLAKRKANTGLLWAMSMILAGAMGNVLDSIFYGKFLNNAPPDAPTPWFHGQVIDMVFFDFWQGYIPDWVPLWGGDWFSMPIFNLADSFIFIGVCSILIFQGTFFPRFEEEEDLSQDSIPNTDDSIISDDAEAAQELPNNDTEAIIEEETTVVSETQADETTTQAKQGEANDDENQLKIEQPQQN
jgi:signal peptidase II